MVVLPCEILELVVRKTQTRELLILAASNEFRYCARSELKSRKLEFIEKQQRKHKKKALFQIRKNYFQRMLKSIDEATREWIR